VKCPRGLRWSSNFSAISRDKWRGIYSAKETEIEKPYDLVHFSRFELSMRKVHSRFRSQVRYLSIGVNWVLALAMESAIGGAAMLATWLAIKPRLGCHHSLLITTVSPGIKGLGLVTGTLTPIMK
jgi:hypothetical protein